MASLTIRNLPDDVRDRLRIRAAVAGRSMEAEAREILATECVDGPAPEAGAALQAWVDKLYGTKKPRAASSDLVRERRREARRK
jgi:plasmid stability protein